MNKKIFYKNNRAVSVMYDAVLFIVMVSLSGVVLIPAVQNNIAIDSSVDKHREHVADEALNSLLVTRADAFSYQVGGDIIESVFENLSIDTSPDGLYGIITSWLLAREQIHKTHANLIAENLGCQFKVPFSLFGTNRINIFTGDYDIKLKEQIELFLKKYLGDKYEYNLTAIWHPVKGVGFGGDIYIGDPTPDLDCYVAQSTIMMPHKPQITVNGTVVNFTRYWLEEEVLKKTPILDDIVTINNLYQNGIEPYDNLDNATKALYENISQLVHGFLIDGLNDSNGTILFPGVIQATIDFGFSKIKNATLNFTQGAIDDLMGEALGSVDKFLGSVCGVDNPVFNAIKDVINDTISDLVGVGYGTLEEGFNLLETEIKNQVAYLVEGFIQPYIDDFITYLFDNFNPILIYDDLASFLFDLISINEAEVTLSVWEVRG